MKGSVFFFDSYIVNLCVIQVVRFGMLFKMFKLTFLACCFTVATGAMASSITLSNPRCEYRDKPVGVEALQPRLKGRSHQLQGA